MITTSRGNRRDCFSTRRSADRLVTKVGQLATREPTIDLVCSAIVSWDRVPTSRDGTEEA